MRTPPIEEVAERARRLKVVVVGGLNVDHNLLVSEIPADDGSARVESYEVTFGGHAGNCACALTRLGVSVKVLGAVGRDAEGDMLLQDLAQCGVEVDSIRRIVGAPTGRVIIPSFPGRRFMLMHRGANDSTLEGLERLESELANADAILLFDPTVRTIEAVLEGAKRLSIPVYWNPGGLLASSTWVGQRMARARAVIMNRVEFRTAFPPGLAQIAMRRSFASNPQLVFVETLGSDGARLHTREAILSERALPVNCVDATGAGDSFTAGFAVFDQIGLAHRTTLQLANTMGALATRRLGARAALPDWQELASSTEAAR